MSIRRIELRIARISHLFCGRVSLEGGQIQYLLVLMLLLLLLLLLCVRMWVLTIIIGARKVKSCLDQC